MNIYLVEWKDAGYGEYDGSVVVAESEDDARTIHPRDNDCGPSYGGWTKKPEDIKVTLLGIAHESLKRGPVFSSYFE